MIPFVKPGTGASYVDVSAAAIRAAFACAGLRYEANEQACAGYVYGDSACGQAMLCEVGLGGIPSSTSTSIARSSSAPLQCFSDVMKRMRE